MRWAREDWIDAIWAATDLKPLERLVGLAYARVAGSNATSYLATSDLMTMTGLSRNPARNAVRGLVASGWLQLVERERQQYAARYRMTIPAQGVSSAPSERVSSAPPESTRGHERTPSGGQEKTPGGAEKTPKLGHQEPPPPSGPDLLWSALVRSLPTHLAVDLLRTPQLDDALRRLLDDGWTEATLAARTAARSWMSAGPGAVVTWLSNLPAAAPASSSAARRCATYGHEHALVTASGCSACNTEGREAVSA